MARRIRFENKGQSYQMRCQFCHRPAKELYQMRFEEGGPLYLLHPGNCSRVSFYNYKTNKNNGVVPTIQQQPDDEPEAIETSREGEDNIIQE